MAHQREYVTVTDRQILYFASFLIAIVELSFTSYRIHTTIEGSNTHDPIIAELLATSILTLLSVPLILQFLQDADERSTGSAGATYGKQRPRKSTLASFFLHRWTVGFLSLTMWIMWLIGAAIATQHWPTSGAAGPGEQGQILTAIVALAWLAFAVVTLARYLVTLERWIRKAIVIDDAREGKPANGTGAPASATAPTGLPARLPASPASTASLASAASVPPPSASRFANAPSSTVPAPAVPPASAANGSPTNPIPAASDSVPSADIGDANPAKVSPNATPTGPGSAT